MLGENNIDSFLEALIEDKVQKRIIELILRNEPKEVILDTIVKELAKENVDRI